MFINKISFNHNLNFHCLLLKAVVMHVCVYINLISFHFLLHIQITCVCGIEITNNSSTYMCANGIMCKVGIISGWCNYYYVVFKSILSLANLRERDESKVPTNSAMCI